MSTEKIPYCFVVKIQRKNNKLLSSYINLDLCYQKAFITYAWDTYIIRLDIKLITLEVAMIFRRLEIGYGGKYMAQK